jgi:hypothetical protein
MDNQVFLGAKAFFLKKLHSLGIPYRTDSCDHGGVQASAVILEHREMGRRSMASSGRRWLNWSGRAVGGSGSR